MFDWGRCIMKQKGCNDVTERERYAIETYLREGLKPKEIAIKLNRHYNTIYKEIKNGTVEILNSRQETIKVYCPEAAQGAYIKNQNEKGRPLKIKDDIELVRYIDERIRIDELSPKTIVDKLKAEGQPYKTSICTSTIYNYIDKGVFGNVSKRICK